MSSYPQIEFYDIACTVTSEPWSPYTARTFLSLRLLDIPFERQKLPMAKIDATLLAAGVEHPAGADRHLLPAITVSPSSTGGAKEWILGSDEIAAYLQKLYLEHGGELSKSLFPDAASKELVEKVRGCFKSSLYAEDRWQNIIPFIYMILDPESQEYFHRTRTEQWGKSPKEVIATDAKKNEERDGGNDKLYALAMQPFGELYDNKDRKEGVWLGGERAIYADLMVIALLQWYKYAKGDAFESGLKQVGGGLEKAWNAGQALLKN
ncbi:uncharacterized protein UTRI_10568_B [Ustilago trichophora]|uniref:Glutathione S-transferase UstS-like C-terminal domain-containing protein n=1 Tax=Ustilago trichophora TaxID=86804 RepID=A0A5C3EBW3_9BASI|nr:uncharacterized protein UTRI_10568_B [Ustilago trichophora]